MDQALSRFLTADWRYLAMLNYEIDPHELASFVPRGTELDQWNGKTFVSVVGFLFLNTRLLGVPIPFHSHFEEVNLRFYVRRETSEGSRRGVVFIKEIVPRRAIAWTARVFYNENYVALPMRHEMKLDAAGSPRKVRYAWGNKHRGHSLSVVPKGPAVLVAPGSEEEFITEHYWGYARQRNGGTVEYKVEHEPWRVWSAGEARLEGDTASLYGQAFARYLDRAPSSAFLAEGSPVTVYKGRWLE